MQDIGRDFWHNKQRERKSRLVTVDGHQVLRENMYDLASVRAPPPYWTGPATEDLRRGYKHRPVESVMVFFLQALRAACCEPLLNFQLSSIATQRLSILSVTM